MMQKGHSSKAQLLLWCFCCSVVVLSSSILVSVSATSVADDNTCDNDDHKEHPPDHLSSPNAIPDTTNEKHMAARRLIESSVIGHHFSSNDGGTANDLLSDLKLFLGESLDEQEILNTMKDAKQRALATKAKRSDNDNHANMYSADRHAAAILDTFQNFDCLEREFDVTDRAFDVEEATRVLEKCRILVLRNVFSKDIVEKTLKQYREFTNDVRTGRIKRDGTTTHGGDYFVLKEDRYRLNYMIPRDLASADILANKVVSKILSHYNLLDEDFIVNHSGTLNAQPGAPPQAWHADAEYLYGRQSFQEYGVAGQDLPPFAISMFTPLINMTYDHGPTEFCLGTAHFRGHYSDLLADDRRLLENGVVADLHRFDQSPHGQVCPIAFQRTPLLGLGDVVLFDYMLNHRGGPNKSNDLRSMLFTVYSRPWYKDWTFDISGDEQTDFERLTQITRFAVVEREDNE
jgi:ectoine hydroxylase-related dioxygenase (phytanoyl-CoA dioxygenase family)